MAVLTGGEGGDVLTGRGERDRIEGAGGNDVLSGGDGSDSIDGGAGDDVIYGFGPADESPEAGTIAAVRVASGLATPVFAVAPPGDPDRLFVLEKDEGRIRILDLATNTLSAAPFLDLPQDEFSGGGERGVLGLAFHPDYAANGRFFIYLTTPAGDLQLREYARGADGSVADPGSGRVLLTVPHPTFANHNGGWIGFGPDGRLYVNTGDGGGSGDPLNNAQNLDSLLGKVLRLDVNGDDFPDDAGRNYAIPGDNPFVGREGADEVFAYGLRNPYRASFDRLTGDLYIGDVGEASREEIDLIPAGSRGGLNFGWRIKEGFSVYSASTPPGPGGPGLVDPLLDYGRGPGGGRSVTGGVVNRGPGGAEGLYVFADFLSGNIWTVRQAGGAGEDFLNRNAQIRADAGSVNLIAAFAEDGRGRVYTVGLDGEIHRLDFGAAAGDAGDRLAGGEGDDRLFGGVGDDVLAGGSGRDRLNGGAGADWIGGGADADAILGQAGDDFMGGEDGDDMINGGAGADVLFGDAGADWIGGGDGADGLFGQAGDDFMGGEAGNDFLDGGDGRDTLFGDAGDDFIIGGTGDDGLAGQDGADIMGGQDGEDFLDGGAGADRLFGDAGRDTILGAAGDDALTGGAGGDVLIGGEGRDRFVLLAPGDSAPGDADFVADFNRLEGDLIDVSAIDADAFTPGDQAFRLTAGFSGQAGEAVLSYDAAANRTVLQLDIDGDRLEDARLVIAGDARDGGGFVL